MAEKFERLILYSRKTRGTLGIVKKKNQKCREFYQISLCSTYSRSEI